MGERGRIVVDKPFVPRWDPTEVAIHVRRTGPEIQLVAGANQFLHMLEHVARAIQGAHQAPAEDGVANVAACVAIRESCAAGSANIVPAS